jgi:hypothetical protein
MSYEVQAESILFSNGTVLRFGGRVEDCLEAGDVLVIRLTREGSERGIYGLKDGEVLWQVEQSPWLNGAYETLYLEGTRLFAWDTAGVKVELDPRNGKILDYVLTK